MNFTDRKIDLIFNLYIDPADQDYIIARIAYANGMFHVFYWTAAQACEKYMKAAVLFQDRSIRDYGHDLDHLFEEIRSFDCLGTIPTEIALPETTAHGREAWQGKSYASFIDYLKSYGSPDNRYAYYGTNVIGPDIHALDALCCAFRRLVRITNFIESDLFEHQSATVLRHDKMTGERNWMIDPLRLLERLFSGRYDVGQGPKLRQSFSNMNFAFFDERSEDERTFGGYHFHGSPLYNHLVRIGNLDTSAANLDAIKQMRDWAKRNLRMSKEVLRQLRYIE